MDFNEIFNGGASDTMKQPIPPQTSSFKNKKKKIKEESDDMSEEIEHNGNSYESSEYSDSIEENEEVTGRVRPNFVPDSSLFPQNNHNQNQNHPIGNLSNVVDSDDEEDIDMDFFNNLDPENVRVWFKSQKLPRQKKEKLQRKLREQNAGLNDMDDENDCDRCDTLTIFDEDNEDIYGAAFKQILKTEKKMKKLGETPRNMAVAISKKYNRLIHKRSLSKGRYTKPKWSSAMLERHYRNHGRHDVFSKLNKHIDICDNIATFIYETGICKQKYINGHKYGPIEIDQAKMNTYFRTMKNMGDLIKIRDSYENNQERIKLLKAQDQTRKNKSKEAVDLKPPKGVFKQIE